MFLLTILLLQAGGMFLIYKMQQYYVQCEMKQSLTNNRTQFLKIIISLRDYQKCKINADEVIIKDKMYDVKSVRLSVNNVELLVINDSKEENILKKMMEYTTSTKHPDTDFLNYLNRLLSVSYLFQETYCNFVIYPSSVDNFLQLTKNIISTFVEIPSPPPKLG